MNCILNRHIASRLSTALIALVVLQTESVPCQAQMTAEEFDALPSGDKRTVLVRNLEDRERAVRNLQASSVTYLHAFEYRDGQTGAQLKDHIGYYACELRRKDGSHWASIDWFLTDMPDRPNQKVVTSLDTKSGIARSIAEQDSLKGVYGAIDTKEDMLIETGRFHFWFDATFEKPQNFPISFLLKHQEAVAFDGLSDNRQEIQISLDVETNEGVRYRDTRTVWLDPQRGFMPVRMHWRWEYDSQPPLDQEVDTVVLKMEQVDGVWFPTHFTETCTCARSLAEQYATVYDTTVSQISLDKMTDDDLQVRFPDKTEVHDRIKGVRFIADEATQSAPAASSQPGVSGSARKSLIFVSVVAFLALFTIFALSKRHKAA